MDRVLSLGVFIRAILREQVTAYGGMILIYVYCFPGCSVNSITVGLDLDKQKVRNAMRSLIRRGFISRTIITTTLHSYTLTVAGDSFVRSLIALV